MHKRVILFFMSSIMFFASLFLLIFFFIALFYREINFDRSVFLLSITGIMLGIAGIMRKFGRKELFELSSKDAILAVALTWTLMIFIGTIPFLTFDFTFVNAFFEASSGFTCTGATIFTYPEKLPASILLWRSIMHWVGGMGIIVFFLTIIPNLGSSGKILFRSEVPGPIKENLTPHLQDTAKQLWLVYLFLTALCIFAFRWAGLDWFDSVNHAFATISTGGFSTESRSLGAFSSQVQWVAIMFMILGATNFNVFLILLTPNRSQILKDSELKFYFIIIFIFSLVCSVLYFLYQNPQLPKSIDSALDAIRLSTFSVVSLLTTTGFTVTDLASLTHPIQGILLILFFVGGCGGSTSGGIKIYRILLIFRAITFQTRKSLDPYLVSSIKISKSKVEKGIVINVFIFVIVYITFFSLGTMLLYMDNNDFLLGFTTSSSMLGNIGPTLFDISPFGDLRGLSNFSKVVSSLLMIFGRLEIFTLLAILHPLFWKRY